MFVGKSYFLQPKNDVDLLNPNVFALECFCFRLSPFFNYTIAIIGNETTGLSESKAYSKIGIGLITNNDYWVFRTFQILLPYYSTIPGSSNNVLKINAFETSDFGF